MIIVNGSCLDRITRLAPVLFSVVHHDIDNGWHNIAQYSRAVMELFAVNRSAKGCTTMNQLVTQGIQPAKNNAQHRCSVVVSQRPMGCAFIRLKPLLPVIRIWQAILVIPVRRINELVIQQQSYAA